ncbi:hypothetical protein mvi_11310 [Methylobacterium indicum]|uniref:Uncharacterized protein n=1 Tax=Methylobacterium indicum TaxID=1775910 RepID=A0A8H9C5I6_9HYPH|nr:hypothetical protein mvi_11310 [Methylobacterium indicum]
MDFMKTDSIAWDPSPVECIRVEGETECGWGLAVVVLTIKQNERRAEAEKRDAEAAHARERPKRPAVASSATHPEP